MEQEPHQWVVHPHEEEEEEGMMEDGALIRKKIVTEEVTSFSSTTSSSSSSSNDSEHDSGTCSVVTAPDGSPVQKDEEVSEIGNGGENFNHVNGDKSDYEAVGLAQVAEFAGEPTNVEAISGFNMSQNMNSVYFDKQQDDEVNGLNGVLNGVANGSVHPTNLGEREVNVQADLSAIQNSLCSENTSQCIKTVDNKLPSIPELSHKHNSSDIQATPVADFHEETSAKEAPNLIKEEIDQPLEEFDVEAVLEKQETHDLFCPNCHSCITKRVILKKRKRNPGKTDIEAKRDKLEKIHNLEHDKLETIGSSGLLDSPEHPNANPGDNANVRSEPDIVSQEPPAEDNQPREEPEVFRCLSCFSFFIPSGKCFDAIRIFGGASKKEGAQNPPSVPASNLQFPSNPQGSSANWFKSLINKGKKASDAPLEYSGTGSAQQHNSTSITSDELTSRGIGHSEDPPADTSVVTDVKPTPDINHAHGGMDSLISSTNDLSSIQSGTKSAGDLVNGMQKVVRDTSDFSYVKPLLDGNLSSEGEKKGYDSLPLAASTPKEAVLKPYEGKTEILTSTTVGFQFLEGTPKDVDKTPEIIGNGYSSVVHGAQSPIQSSGSAIHANDVASNKQNFKTDAIFPSKLDFTPIDKEIYPPTRKENEGGDVIVDIGKGTFVSAAPHTADDIPAESTTITETQIETVQPRDEVGEPQGWEILKSIVYGGLVESITSLGIVSSAVSSGVTPLNIIALGFANIIGGLVILGHNLVDLKNDHSGEDQTQTVVQDRYREFLGRRENFLLHAVVAVLSFLIFGAVPLVVYGLLINKSYDTELKLAVVAATSVVCIILLAIGKVYTSRPPKAYMKTVLYYVAMALSTSGVTYIAGNLIKDLLEKYNHPESGFAITMMPISGTNTGSTWMSQ
ncbi:membrane protein of ER body-like protein isoform X3 [Vigna unguiculata]|uniref:membrane protein of ER body-like protein isoform X3 n=1 Tax=Vigna unguiculata TaxID=3917 RepID=UPI001016564C|nr:membrane protein of ER body-like protein isoform X3 [Vigna unguiculata]